RVGGQCTFVAESGHRCEARTRLEFDHVHPVARGGDTTAANMRLRCRAHNQYAAERVFGKAFMRGKRENARARPDPDHDVVPWLRALGFRADEARRAAARCVAMPDVSLEKRVRVALSSLAPARVQRPAQISSVRTMPA
ncbi:MAG: HNH endonuclease, partial [Candidatus Eisenbacteria bacterium]